MPMLPAPYRMSQQGSSWGGFGRAPRQQVPTGAQGMGAYAGAGNMPPAPQLQGMGQRTLTPEMAAQYRPQMMASALMQPQQQLGMTPSATSLAAMEQSAMPGPQNWAPPQGATAMQPQMGIAQAAPQQQLGYASQPTQGALAAQPVQAQLQPPRGLAR